MTPAVVSFHLSVSVLVIFLPHHRFGSTSLAVLPRCFLSANICFLLIGQQPERHSVAQ